MSNGVFPETDSVSASIKASQALGIFLEDWDGSAENYKSFEEAGAKGQAELDRLVECGRATKVPSWSEVVQHVGEGAKLTKLACVIKQKDGAEKVRLVVDMRRSGINGLMMLRERVILPIGFQMWPKACTRCSSRTIGALTLISSSAISETLSIHFHLGPLSASLQWSKGASPHFT